MMLVIVKLMLHRWYADAGPMARALRRESFGHRRAIIRAGLVAWRDSWRVRRSLAIEYVLIASRTGFRVVLCTFKMWQAASNRCVGIANCRATHIWRELARSLGDWRAHAPRIRYAHELDDLALLAGTNTAQQRLQTRMAQSFFTWHRVCVDELPRVIRHLLRVRRRMEEAKVSALLPVSPLYVSC